jgi:hypothetical protein
MFFESIHYPTSGPTLLVMAGHPVPLQGKAASAGCSVTTESNHTHSARNRPKIRIQLPAPLG